MAIKTYTKGVKTQLSTNFKSTEFDCHGSGCCSSTQVDEELVKILQRIRDHFGKPLNTDVRFIIRKLVELLALIIRKDKLQTFILAALHLLKLLNMLKVSAYWVLAFMKLTQMVTLFMWIQEPVNHSGMVNLKSIVTLSAETNLWQNLTQVKLILMQLTQR